MQRNVKPFFATIQMLPIRLLFFALSGIVALGYAVLFTTALLGKPIGDDFVAIVMYSPQKVLQTFGDEIASTGRPGQSVLSAGIYATFGSHVAQLIPIVIVTWFLTLIYLFIRMLLLKVNPEISRGLTAWISWVFFFLIFFTNDNPVALDYPVWFTFQNLFWTSAIITYTIPLALYLTGLYFFIQLNDRRKRPLAWASFLIATFLISLVNEILPATLISISGITLALSYIPFWRSQFKRIRLELVGTIFVSSCAFLIMVLSKGSQARQSSTDSKLSSSSVDALLREFNSFLTTWGLRPVDVFLIGSASFLTALIFVSRWGRGHEKIKEFNRDVRKLSIWLLMSFICSFAIGLLLPIVGYGAWTPPLTRTLFTSQLFLILAIFLVFFSLSIDLIVRSTLPFQSVIATALLICICFSAGTIGYRLKSQLTSVTGYFVAWNEYLPIITKSVSDSPGTTIYLPKVMNGIGNRDFIISCENHYWLGDAIALYFGANRICSETDN